MKITKARLKQIIQEEMKGQLDEIGIGGFLAGVDQDDPKFLAWKAKQKPHGIEMPPSLEDRVAKLEARLDELERSLGGTAATEIELEE